MLRTFIKGGVHPPENKLSANKKIETLPLPQQVKVPMAQHLGAPATPVVKKKDKVLVGQIIGKSSGFVSANVHSPVSGTVNKIDEVFDASGYRKTTVVIDVEGDDWLEDIDRREDLVEQCSLSPKEIIQKVADAGVVGLGGATFPTHIKLTPPPGKKAEILIINGVECEPYLTSDHRLMMEKGPEIVVGISLLMKAMDLNQAVIGIENNKKDAIAYFKELTKKREAIKVVPLKVKYPQGGEKQLIQAVTGREVPSGKLPVEVGAVVQNVGTVFAVYEAVQKNKPVFERIITVTGKSLKEPKNFKVRIGCSVDELIKAAGDLPEDTGKIISGGPMMGKALIDTDIPVTKGSSGVLLIPKSESERKEVKPCIRCTKCVQVCPMALEPYLLMTLAQKNLFERLETDKVMDCIECGSCSFTCPSNRPLLDYIRYGKTEVGKIIRSRNK